MDPKENQMSDVTTNTIIQVCAKLTQMIQNSNQKNQLLATLERVSQEQRIANAALVAQVNEQVQKAFDLLLSISENNATKNKASQVREQRDYIDGCFDLVHCGHFNAIRQGSIISSWLVTGVCSDEEILKAKGPTVMKHDERAAIINAVKWVDEVAPNTPYDCTESLLDELNCQSYIHGDDPCYTAEGELVQDVLSEIDRFKLIKRTTGISTTDITGRLLKLLETDEDEEITLGLKSRIADAPKQQFLQTSTRISNFSNRSDPKPGDTVVYFSVSCDLMHPGVIERLRLAKEQGDYLYVGLWDDETIRYYKGSRYPLQGLQERTLMALAIKYVDDVVIGAPYIITEDLIRSLNISKVVHVVTAEDQVKEEFRSIDPNAVAKEQGIYVKLPQIENDLTLEQIAQRVADNRAAFQAKYDKKKAKEDDYYAKKKPLSECSTPTPNKKQSTTTSQSCSVTSDHDSK